MPRCRDGIELGTTIYAPAPKPGTPPETPSAEMLDVMTNTSFEDRLPQPLPEKTRVSHKIGSYGTTFSDAGLVFPEGSRDPKDAYFIIVMASETGEFTARTAMREMSLATYESITGPADAADDGRRCTSGRDLYLPIPMAAPKRTSL